MRSIEHATVSLIMNNPQKENFTTKIEFLKKVSYFKVTDSRQSLYYVIFISNHFLKFLEKFLGHHKLFT